MKKNESQENIFSAYVFLTIAKFGNFAARDDWSTTHFGKLFLDSSSRENFEKAVSLLNKLPDYQAAGEKATDETLERQRVIWRL